MLSNPALRFFRARLVWGNHLVPPVREGTNTFFPIDSADNFRLALFKGLYLKYKRKLRNVKFNKQIRRIYVPRFL